MGPVFEGSILVKFCRAIGQKWTQAAQSSLILGRKKRAYTPRKSGIAALLNRIHLASSFEKTLAESRVCQWLYGYARQLAGLQLFHLLLLAVPSLLTAAVASAVKGQWIQGGLLLILAGVLILLLGKNKPLAPLLGGSRLLGRWKESLSAPQAPCKPSVTAYLCCCGLCGGAVSCFFGAAAGLVPAVVLGIFPVFFAVPPHWFLYLMMAVLPIGSTTLCWGMSAALCLLYFFGRAFGNEKGRALDGTDVLLMIFPLFCLISTLFSFHLVGSAKVTVMWLGLFICVFAVRRIVCTRRRLLGTLYAFGLGAALSGGYGLYQYLSGMVNTTWTDTALFEDLEVRIYSTFANPNVFGEFLLFAIPLVTGLLLYEKSRRKKLLWAAVDLLLICNMALTYSRGCYVGIALTAVFFLWHFSKKWLGIAAAAAVPLALLLMPQTVLDRLMSIGNMSDTSTSFRVYIYIGTGLMLARHWFGGVGLGEEAFNSIYPYYSLPAILTPHSHSLFLQAVCSFGIAGLFYLLWAFTHYQRATGAARDRVSGGERGLMLGFNTLFWGMILQSVFDYTWYNYRVFQLFWILFALGLCAAEIFLNDPSEEVQIDEKTSL